MKYYSECVTIVLIFMISTITSSNCAAVSSGTKTSTQDPTDAFCSSELCSYSSATVINTDRWCRCDPKCDESKDCCYDYGDVKKSISATGFEKPFPNAEFKCTNVPTLGLNFIVSSCAAKSAHSPNVSSISTILCNGKFDEQSHILDIPVTSGATGITYKNVHCAICNEDADDLLPRKAALYGELPLEGAMYVDGTLSWVQSLDNISGRLHQKERLVNNSVLMANETKFRLFLDSEFIQPCPRFLNSCLPNWEVENDDTYKLCLAYSMPVYMKRGGTKGQIFKNPHCALCNNVAFSDLDCHGVQQGVINGIVDGVMLPQISFNFGNVTAGHENCGMKSVWDPLLNKCYQLNVAEEFGNYNTTPESISDPMNEVSTKLGQTDSLQEGNTKQENGNCKDTSLLTMSKVQWYLAYAVFSISITCLCLHVVSYAYPRELSESSPREPSNMTLSSRLSLEYKQITGHSFIMLSWLLLIGQLLFVVGALRTEVRAICISVAVLHNFLSLAAISWLSVFCLQVFKSHFSLRSFKSMHSLESGSDVPPLKLSLIAWIIPTVFSSLCLTLELVPGDLRPCLARGGACWYGETVSFRIFFVLPALLMLAGDGCIFTAIIFGINDKKDQKISTSSRGRNNSLHRRCSSIVTNYDHRCFRLCARLGIIMTLSWSCAAAASLANLPSLWYGYVLFSGFQGIYVFVASGTKSIVTNLIWFRAKGQPGHVRRERSIKNNSKSAANS